MQFVQSAVNIVLTCSQLISNAQSDTMASGAEAFSVAPSATAIGRSVITVMATGVKLVKELGISMSANFDKTISK